MRVKIDDHLLLLDVCWIVQMTSHLRNLDMLKGNLLGARKERANVF